jgi:hypothetical protein
MNNPCEQCIVKSMCNKKCGDLEDYVKGLIPSELRSSFGIKAVTSWLRASANNEKINDIRVTFNTSIKNTMFLDLHPSIKMFITKGKITKMILNESYQWPKRWGFNIFSYSKPGFEIIITHTGLKLSSKSSIYPENLK